MERHGDHEAVLRFLVSGRSVIRDSGVVVVGVVVVVG
jgi:hypothetical protein